MALDQHGFVADVNATADAVFDHNIKIKTGGCSFAIPPRGRCSKKPSIN